MPDATSIPITDRLDILDLYARQSHAIDGGDFAAWAATFTPDGLFTSSTFGVTAVGTQELIEFAKHAAQVAEGRKVELRHWVGQVAMRPSNGTDIVEVSAYMLIVATSRNTSTIDRSLRIEDNLARTTPGWLFAKRIVLRDDARLK
jgi:3-phenylpropionate/cinnamic acid dioxygenase small subunit